MYFNVVLLAALLCDISLAGFNIKYYESDHCKGTIGHTCPDVQQRECCFKARKRFQSAEFDEAGGSCDDQLKIYPDTKCEGIPLDQGTHPACVRSSSKNVEGAKVFIVISTAKRDESGIDEAVETEDGTGRAVQVSESFYLNGTVRHVIKLDSSEGRAFELLEKDEDRIGHLVRFGRREEVAVSEKMGSCKRTKGGPKGGAGTGKGSKGKGGKGSKL